MHGTSTNNTTASQVRAGDAQLSAELPLLLNSAEYLSGTTAIFLTWDEGAGTSSDIRFDHYSMLKTTEGLLGYPATLGHAADPETVSMASAFNLTPILPPATTAPLP